MNTEISWKNILTVGPYDRGNKGGISLVIANYRKMGKGMHIISTYHTGRSLFVNIWIYIFSLAKLFEKLLWQKEIEIVHIHGASGGSFYRKYLIFLISKYLFGKKIIYHAHGGGFLSFFAASGKWVKGKIRSFLTEADLIICLSEISRLGYENTFGVTHIAVVPNPISKPANIRKVKNDKVHFLFLGTIIKTKGIYDLLEVAAMMANQERKDFRLIIGGEGEQKKLSRLIKEKHLEDHIYFPGWIGGKQKEDWLQASDVFILPSYFEGLPVSVLEAMSYRMAVIATNVGGIPELIRRGQNGYLFDPGDKEALQMLMKRFIENPALISRFGEQSASIVEKYSLENIAATLNTLYNNILHHEPEIQQCAPN